MKKFLLTMSMTLCVVFAMAQKNYTDNLVVTINGEMAGMQSSTILVEEQADGTCNLSLKNFYLGEIAVGTINLYGVEMKNAGSYSEIEAEQNILIAPGDDDADWLGPALGEVPVKLQGKISDEKLYCTIDIVMILDPENLEDKMVVGVTFGSDFTTAIEGVEAEEGEDVIYDLLGRRIEKVTAPGVYIINGVKKIVK